MAEDLSKYHAPMTKLFPAPAVAEGWGAYRLTDEQVAFYEEQGYLSGVRMCDDAQVERLRAELAELMNPAHPARELWYEFHSNESADPAREPRRGTQFAVYLRAVEATAEVGARLQSELPMGRASSSSSWTTRTPSGRSRRRP